VNGGVKIKEGGKKKHEWMMYELQVWENDTSA
jgi:hypothetical protein